MEQGTAEVGVQAAGPDGGQPRSLWTQRRRAIEVDGHAQLRPDPAPQGVGQRRASFDGGPVQRHDGHDIGGAHAGMNARVRAQVDPAHSLGDGSQQALGQSLGRGGCEREDEAVVVRVGVGVEHVHSASGGRSADGFHDCRGPTLGEVRDGLEKVSQQGDL